jgi:hypothetical protein
MNEQLILMKKKTAPTKRMAVATANLEKIEVGTARDIIQELLANRFPIPTP